MDKNIHVHLFTNKRQASSIAGSCLVLMEGCLRRSAFKSGKVMKRGSLEGTL